MRERGKGAADQNECENAEGAAHQHGAHAKKPRRIGRARLPNIAALRGQRDESSSMASLRIWDCAPMAERAACVQPWRGLVGLSAVR
ncbi:hypothetical protein NBRGN_035_00110 [Nocardia brasiliensis NBRC 14402]|nr:hypothetical protein NBRGN_035_00110 [Nocardia brasiliensis NBRC 14402]